MKLNLNVLVIKIQCQQLVSVPGSLKLECNLWFVFVQLEERVTRVTERLWSDGENTGGEQDNSN